MNNKAKFTALGLVSLFTFTVACGVAILSNNSTFEPLIADGEDPEEKEVTLEAAELSAVSFSDHDFGRAKQETNNKGDQEFRINLANGNYIDGALIFSDCGHCNIGNTLGDVFQLDNSLQDSGNSFNFNFFFNVRGIKQATIYYTSTITGEPFVVTSCCSLPARPGRPGKPSATASMPIAGCMSWTSPFRKTPSLPSAGLWKPATVRSWMSS